MITHWIDRGGVGLHVVEEGDTNGAPLIFSTSLGTTLSLWDQVIARLPQGLRIIRYDMRGHGQSDVPPAPYAMGAMVSDAEAICDALAVRDAVFVGLSVGGMIGQGLAVKRLDLVRGLVLSNTAAKIGTKSLWQDRIDAVRSSGMAALAPGVMDRWFGKTFADDARGPWQAMLESIDPEGYVGVCAAIAGTDFLTPTSGLRLPLLAIAGSEDKSTPPDLVRETCDLVPGSEFHLIRRSGHLPPVDNPDAFADALIGFLIRIGHLGGPLDD